jgi:hypothetical protein
MNQSEPVEKNASAALAWIAEMLKSQNIPFQVTGGLAALVYGSTRPLADIDIDVPDEYLAELAGLLAGHVLSGPARYRDGEWDIMLLTVQYAGCEIDLGGVPGAKVFDRAARSWVPLVTDLESAVPLKVFGVEVPVIAKHALIAYKRRLDRDVDRMDITAMESTPSTAS